MISKMWCLGWPQHSWGSRCRTAHVGLDSCTHTSPQAALPTTDAGNHWENIALFPQLSPSVWKGVGLGWRGWVNLVSAEGREAPPEALVLLPRCVIEAKTQGRGMLVSAYCSESQRLEAAALRWHKYRALGCVLFSQSVVKKISAFLCNRR